MDVLRFLRLSGVPSFPEASEAANASLQQDLGICASLLSARFMDNEEFSYCVDLHFTSDWFFFLRNIIIIIDCLALKLVPNMFLEETNFMLDCGW